MVPGVGASAGRGEMRRRGIAASVACLLGPLVVAGSIPAGAQPVAGATCATFNAASEPSSRFEPGDAITVRGTGFGAKSLVLVSFQQGTRTVELARATANDLGAFRASNAQIPSSVIGGKASIRALDARGSAICTIRVIGGTEQEGGLGALYVVWGSLLAAFGVFLAALTYRRWKADRLRDAMDALARRDGTGESDDTREPQRHLVRETASARSAISDAPPFVPRWARRSSSSFDDEEIVGADDEFADEWAFREHGPAGWVRDPIPTAPKEQQDVEPTEGDELQEPPLLPDDWDDGRLKPTRRTSDAIERLRREVGSWKRP